MPDFIETRSFTAVGDLKAMLEELKVGKASFKMIVNVAALSDFAPVRKEGGKISSCKGELVLKLKQTEKILPLLRRYFPSALLVAYKLESAAGGSVGEKQLLEKARGLLEETACELVVANDLKKVGEKTTSVLILEKGKKKAGHFSGSKDELAELLLDLV